jgi:hypothetical protein
MEKEYMTLFFKSLPWLYMKNGFAVVAEKKRDGVEVVT